MNKKRISLILSLILSLNLLFYYQAPQLASLSQLRSNAPLANASDNLPNKNEAMLKSKNESIYGILSPEGQVENIYAVNELILTKNGRLVDYGDYKDLINLNASGSITYKDKTVEVDSEEDTFYYKGLMTSKDLPWIFSIEYYLDGINTPSKDLAGKDGALTIKLKIEKNEKINPIYFDNYVMQISLTLDSNKCKNIVAHGATQASAGSDKILTYMLLPGKEGEYIITSDVEDFEMKSITMNGLSFKMALNPDDIDIDTSSFTSKFTELKDGVIELDKGSRDLYKGVKDLDKGVLDIKNATTDLNDGTKQLNTGAKEIADGTSQLSEGLDKALDGAEEFDRGLDDLKAGGKDLKNASQDLADGAKELNDGLNKLSKENKKLLDGARQLADGMLEMADAQIRSQISIPKLTWENYDLIIGNLTSVPDDLRLKARGEIKDKIETQSPGAGANIDLILYLASYENVYPEKAVEEAGKKLLTLNNALPSLIRIKERVPMVEAALEKAGQKAKQMAQLGLEVPPLPLLIDDVYNIITLMALSNNLLELQIANQMAQAGTIYPPDLKGQADIFSALMLGGSFTIMEGEQIKKYTSPGLITSLMQKGLSREEAEKQASLILVMAAQNTNPPANSDPTNTLIKNNFLRKDLKKLNYADLGTLNTINMTVTGAGTKILYSFNDNLVNTVPNDLELANNNAHMAMLVEEARQKIALAGGDPLKVEKISDFLKKLVLSEGVSELGKLEEALDGASMFLYGLEQYLGGLDKLDKGADEFYSGINKFKEGQVDFYDGLLKAKDGFSDLLSGMTDISNAGKDLKKGLAEYLDGIEEYTDGMLRYTEGISDLKTGTSDLLSGVRKLKDGTGTFRSKTSNIDEQVEKEIRKELDALSEKFAQDDFKPSSFTSEKNILVDNVQFVIKTDAIKKEKVELVIEEPVDDRTFWQRLLDLFK